MAGPWFTVLENGADWKTLETIYISNGQGHDRAKVEMRVELVDAES